MARDGRDDRGVYVNMQDSHLLYEYRKTSKVFRGLECRFGSGLTL